MNIQSGKLAVAGILLSLVIVATAVFGSDLCLSQEDRKGRTETEASATTFEGSLVGAGALMRESTRQALSLGGKEVSAVVASAGAGSLEVATLEQVKVPAVTAEETTEEAATTTAPAVETEAAQPKDEWAGKVMAKVQESANVRREANEEAELVGHLPNGACADIVEQGAEWTKIASGSVEGYVKNEFLAFGDEARQLADSQRVAKVLAETLRIRKEANENAAVLTLASVGEELKVTDVMDGWVAVSKGKVSGFVSAEFVEVTHKLGRATSIEEERAAEAARKAAEEKAKAEAARKAEAAAAKAKERSVETTQREATAADTDEATLLGALIQVEAGGQSYECQLAVGSVIINRVNSGRFPNSISGVIYQKGQFPGAHNGKVARVLSNGVKSSCMNAAYAVLSGTNNIGDYLFFNMSGAVSKGRLSDYVIIDGECFY